MRPGFAEGAFLFLGLFFGAPVSQRRAAALKTLPITPVIFRQYRSFFGTDYY
jgi:hypothetical protein